MQPQALVNQAAPSDLHSPFPVWRRASRWHGGVARPEGAVRCKGSGHGQPRAGSPSLLGCVVATEVVTGTRSPPPPPPTPHKPSRGGRPGVEPGHSHSLREDPVHPGAAGSPGGYLPGRIAREANSSHQRGRPALPVQPTRRIRQKPRGQTVRKHTHSLADQKHHNSKPE